MNLLNNIFILVLMRSIHEELDEKKRICNSLQNKRNMFVKRKILRLHITETTYVFRSDSYFFFLLHEV